MYVLSGLSLMSAPAANALSLPVSTIAPIAGSASRSSNAAPISATRAAFSALSACGRFSVTTPTAPRRSSRMFVYCPPVMTPLLLFDRGGGAAVQFVSGSAYGCQRAGGRGGRRSSDRTGRPPWWVILLLVFTNNSFRDILNLETNDLNPISERQALVCRV